MLAELKAGKDFGELARKYSGDPGSAAQGGDLGWGDRSAYVAPFSEALFKLQPGQISDPVKTQFGYHIIRLDEVRAAHVRSLEDSRAEIEAAYRHDQASELFGDRQEQLQQKIESGQGTNLAALAMEFGLQVGDVPQFTRSGGAPLDGKPELVAAVFDPDVLSGKRLGGPVALSDDRLVIVRVLEHHAPAAQPLASVHAEIIAAIRKSEGTRAARAAADAAVKRLEGGENADAVFKSLGVPAGPASFRRAQRSAAAGPAAPGCLLGAAARGRQAGLSRAVARQRRRGAADRQCGQAGHRRQQCDQRPAAARAVPEARSRGRARRL